MNYTKPMLVRLISRETGLSHAQVVSVIDALTNKITKELCRGNTIEIHNFGSFSTRVSPAKLGINPQTKQILPRQAKRVVKFKPRPKLAELVNKDKQ